MKTTITHPMRLTAGAASLLLLAACGSESGLPAQGNAPTEKQPPAVQSAPASEAASAAPSALAKKARPADAYTAGSTPGINESGISGEALSLMLTWGSLYHGKLPEFYVYPAYPWRGPGPHGFVRFWELGRISKIYGGQTLSGPMPEDPFLDDDLFYNGKPGTTPFQYRQSIWFGYDKQVPDVPLKSVDNELTMFFGVPASYLGEDVTKRQYRFDYREWKDTRLLSLSTDARAKVYTGKHQPGARPAQTFALKARTAYDIKANARIPFNQVIQEWRDARGNFLQLMILKGRHPDQARLCLNQKLADIQRLSCTLWKVPATSPMILGLDGSHASLSYHGLYVEDDSTPDLGQKKKRYWQSTNHFPWLPVRPISHFGVRGDLLARVLSSFVNPHPPFIGPDYPSWSGRLRNGAFPSGNAVNQPDIPDAEGWSTFAAEAGNPKSYRHTFFSFKESIASNSKFRFDALDVSVPLDMRVGAFFEGIDYSMERLYYGRYLFTVDGDPRLNRTLLTLGQEMTLTHTDDRDFGKAKTSLKLHADRAYRVRYARPVAFNRVLQRWHSADGQTVQMLLLPGADKKQFRLCLDMYLSKVTRRSCSMWEVPDDWKIDAPVDFRGIYVEDNRKPLGEDRRLVWWSKPEVSRVAD